MIFGLKRCRLMAISMALFFMPMAVSGHQGATGIVKERMDAMKDIAGLMKRLDGLTFAQQEQDRKAAKAAAMQLSAHGQKMVSLFPAGSIMGPSEATLAIWQQPDAFAAIANNLKMAADGLAAQSDTLERNADMKPHVRRLGATCAACHKDFRRKK